MVRDGTARSFSIMLTRKTTVYRFSTSSVNIHCGLLLFFVVAGCSQLEKGPDSLRGWDIASYLYDEQSPRFHREASAHVMLKWDAKDYFSDSSTIELCKAIQANDISTMKQLIDAGADVNAVGNDGMTPLLWSFPGRKLERFETLLKAGADPSVVIRSDFNTKGVIRVGTTVAHMCAGHRRPDHLFALVANHVDPNIRAASRMDQRDESLIEAALMSKGTKIQERVEALLKLHPDKSRLERDARVAIGQEQFTIGLALLEAGANTKNYTNWGTLVHLVATLEGRNSRPPKDHKLLVDWLIRHGEDYDAAKSDNDRWNAELIKAVDPKFPAATRRNELMERAKEQGSTYVES